MKKMLGQICAELTSVGKPERIKGKSYHKLTFRNMDRDDRREYVLYVIVGYSNSKRFLRLSVGSKLKGVRTYTENDKFYVDVTSDVKEIKARPLF